MTENAMTEKDYKHFQRVAARIASILERNEIVLLSDYIREYNAANPKSPVAFSTAAQACRELRLPAIQIGTRGNWLVPRGAIDAAREAGVVSSGSQGRPLARLHWEGECPMCGKNLRGTSRKMTVRHYKPDTTTICKGWKKPLINPKKVDE